MDIMLVNLIAQVSTLAVYFIMAWIVTFYLLCK